MADKDDKNPENYDEYLPSKEEVEAWLNSEDFDSDSEEDPVAAEAGAAAEADEAGIDHDPDPTEEVSWEDDEVNPNKGSSFSVPAPVPGERLIPYTELEPWTHHPAFASRLRGASFEALCASANDPANLPPITVIQTKDGWKVMDGRLRWHAIGTVHGATSEIGVRCQVFEGTEKQALEWLADAAVGCEPRSPIEQARAIWNLQKIAGDSQKAITERYLILQKDQVSRMTIAARTVERFPSVFNLLAEPDRVPIDTCVKFARWFKAAGEETRAEMLKAAEALESEFIALSGSGDGEPSLLKPSELFDALGIEIEGGGAKAKASSPVEVSDVLETIDIFGADDQPIGIVEKLDERVMRFQLPDPASMSPDEREAAAQGYIKQILDYFGLKNPD